jgi:Type II secretion system (T2SS), protein E, N-terminal domain
MWVSGLLCANRFSLFDLIVQRPVTPQPDMASQFQDLDLQDIQFLMETAAIAQTAVPPTRSTHNHYFRPDDTIAVDALADQPEGDEAPTVVLPASIDMTRSFRLINKVLPFEACLYHEILPLDRQGDELYLGMVDLEDTEALTYARRMLGFLKYKLVPQTISSETHRQALSAYLSEQEQMSGIAALPEHTTASPSVESPVPEVPHTLHLSEQDRLTDWPQPPVTPPAPVVDVAVKPTLLILDDDGPSIVAPGESQVEPPEPTIETPFEFPGSALPELQLQSPPPGASWQSLSGEAFMHGLLVRMMASGVGRLFLVHKPGGGQVLWTENGAAKMRLEQVAQDQFRGAIAALKQLTHLPIATVQAPIEVEIERFYQRQRILLRLRITPKDGGEEATIQVLRGAALKFYQKHQIHNLRRDTSAIAQELRQKVLELGRRNHQGEVDRSTLPEIDRTIASLEDQLIQLKQLRHNLKGEG